MQKLFLKTILSMLMIFVVAIPATAEMNSESTQPTIKVGVIPSAETIHIGSPDSFIIRDQETKEEIFVGIDTDVEVSLSEGVSSEEEIVYRLWVAFKTDQTEVNNWINLVNQEGYPTYVKQESNGFDLYIGEFAQDTSFFIRNTFRNEVISKGLAGYDSAWNLMNKDQEGGLLKITHGNEIIFTSNPIIIEAASNLIHMEGKSYRGLGQITINNTNRLTGINILPLEEYLQGVVPLQLDPLLFDKIEAHKAQAIVARTYTLSNLGKRSSEGYDLLATAEDQLYGGYEVEHPFSTEAVESTKGMAATYQEDLIDAKYSYSSGGFTANNEDVWDFESIPYLRGVPDRESGNSLEHIHSLEVFKNHSNPKSLRSAKKGDFESEWSSHHRWSHFWTLQEMNEVLSSYFDQDVGQILEINVLERTNSGRVLKIEFVTENGIFYEHKDTIRWALKYTDDNDQQNILLSTLFYIEKMINSNTKEVIGFTIYGGGWGHGVGLSQTGAVGMASKEYNYEEILNHYYQGIDIERYY